jgi:sulfur-oxidizing protein SoxY
MPGQLKRWTCNVERRELLIGAGAALSLAALLRPLDPALSQTLPQQPATAPVPTWQDELTRIIGTARPVEAKITADLPDMVDNGNVVPFTVTVESGMTQSDHVRAIHLIATGNPLPLVATFRLSTDSGLATVSSRMRLAKTQEVLVIAELSDDSFRLTRRSVRVNIACCGY